MIDFIKNLFKKPQPFVWKKTPIRPDTLEEKTFSIFKATKLHPAIQKDGQEAFWVKCKTLLDDDVLDRVIDEVVGEFAEAIIQTAKSSFRLRALRNKMLGADEVRKRLQKYANSLENKEPVSKYDTI